MSFPPKGDEFNVQHPQEVFQGELTNMKAQLGKQTGLALALLATLLATLFAMGVFSVAQADNHSATRSISPMEVTPGGEVTVVIALSGHEGEQAILSDTLPDGFSFVTGSIGGGGLPNLSGNRISVVLGAVGTVTEITYKAMAPPDPVDAAQFSGTFAVGGDERAIVGDSMVTVAEVVTPTEPVSAVALSSKTPGAAVQITISDVAAEAIAPNQDIRVDLSAFSVPSTIADSAIDITSEGYTGNPSNVVVSGSNVTMTVPNVKANGDDQTRSVEGSYSIRIKQSAGVTNAASGGSKTVKWVENFPNEAEAANKEASVDINRVVSLSKKSGTRGTMITATFKGFANGSATINLNGEKLAEVTIADNSGTLEIDTSSSDFKANQANTITAVDAAGNSQNVSGTFTVKPKAVVDPDESPVSKEITVKLSDWPTSVTITEVKIGASAMDGNGNSLVPDPAPSTGDNGKVEFKVTVPAGANRGTQTVKVTGSDETSATASLSVGVLSLDVQPSSVVPGQEITITGSGFKADDKISKVTVGGKDVVLDEAATASSAGNIVITINIPSPAGDDAGIGDGEKTVEVAATGSGRVAEGSIEIPKAEISLSPDTSRRGTEVSVSGSGFPAGDLVQVKYEGTVVAAKATDSSGHFTTDFEVPNSASIGSKHEVEAVSVGNFKGESAKADHSTPGAVIELSVARTACASGDSRSPSSGMNFPAFSTVATMEIGGVDVRPVPAPATSIDGDFESTILVPGLDLGNQNVKVEVKPVTITTFLEIVTVAVSRAPADVFASLGDRLSRVWYLDRATQAWSFYDPAEEFADFNTLDERLQRPGGPGYHLRRRRDHRVPGNHPVRRHQPDSPGLGRARSTKGRLSH